MLCMVFFCLLSMEDTFKTLILKATHRTDWIRIAHDCALDQSKLDLLVKVFLGDNSRLQQRSSNIINHFFEMFPHRLLQYADQIVFALNQELIFPAVKRNVVRLMQFVDLRSLREETLSFLINTCFKFLQDAKEPIAVRAFSMTVLYNASLIYPELRNELRPILEEVLLYGSAGEKSRARKTLNSFRR
jgi:hypothetical protein